MIEFLRKLFAPETSGATARERLRLVLLSDHLSLAPDVVESLRADLISVISKYVEVDEANCDVSFEQQDRAVAVMANIPIVSMRERRPPPPSAPPPAVPPPTPEPPPMSDPIGATYAVADTGGPTALEQPTVVRAKRRRRKRAAIKAAPAGG